MKGMKEKVYRGMAYVLPVAMAIILPLAFAGGPGISVV